MLELFDGAEQAIIIAPFITKKGMQPIVNALPKQAKLTVYTRWRPDEIAAGVSDPSIFFEMNQFASFYLQPRLHAKAYLVPGRGALVGSSNVTAMGLGWHGGSGIELLSATRADDPALGELVRFLDTCCSLATEQIAEEVLRQAQVFGRRRRGYLPVVFSEPAWLPKFAMPKILWRVYIEERDQSVTDLAKPDLDALELPDGMQEAEFQAYIGAALLQGLPGRIAEETKNLSTYQAIRKLEQIASRANIKIGDPENSWRTLCTWLAYFLPDMYRLAAGGRMLYG